MTEIYSIIYYSVFYKRCCCDQYFSTAENDVGGRFFRNGKKINH